MKKMLNGVLMDMTSEEVILKNKHTEEWLKEQSKNNQTKQYQRDRQAEYPNLQEAIHALLDGGDTLTELQAKRTAIKTKYPKSGA